ncbi:MAG: methylmalonyl-CoA mutase [Chloroflexi bacterium]|nr:methylmalonyl-CoA mutase [Chloroflexota bacterium]
MKEEQERKKEFRTTVDGTVVKRVYTQADVNGGLDTSLPGEYPYTRNIWPAGYRTRLWTVRQYSGFATVEESNKRYKFLYQQGNTGFSVAFHLPTQIGYDSDHPMAAGEVGRCGVAIDSLADMERLWDGIPLAEVSTSMTINATAPIILAMYIAAAEKQGADPRKLRGTVQNDLLKEFCARNTYIFNPDASMRLITDLCAYCAENMPEWNSLSICSYHIREAGATAIQEAAFCLADGIAYVEAMLRRGLPVDSFAPRFSFMLACNMNLLEEVAKFRAMRRTWAKLMKERFGARDPRSMMFRFHVQNDGATSTAQQPLNNIIRTTIEALACVLSGCQSLCTTSYDEALALPSEEAVQIAIRTQQIIAYESGVADTVDPLGGSHYVEWLTNHIEEGIRDYIAKIDAMGGALEAVKQGYIQKEIARSAYDYQKAVDSGEQVVVGLNKFTTDEKVNLSLLEIPEEVERKQIERVRKLRAERDNAAVQEALAEVRRVAESNENVMPVLIKAVKTCATLGELADVFRSVFGEYREPNIL